MTFYIDRDPTITTSPDEWVMHISIDSVSSLDLSLTKIIGKDDLIIKKDVFSRRFYIKTIKKSTSWFYELNTITNKEIKFDDFINVLKDSYVFGRVEIELYFP